MKVLDDHEPSPRLYTAQPSTLHESETGADPTRTAERGPMLIRGYASKPARNQRRATALHVSSPSAHLLGHHDLDELLVVDLAVTVNVGLADHLVDLLVGQLLAEVGHDVAQLSRRDEAVAVLVEDAERLLQLLLRVRVLHLARHEGAELREVNGAVAVGIDLVDHVLQLSLRRVLAERAHHGAQLLGGDGAVAVLVEQRERLLELGDLLLSQLLVTHVAVC